MGGMVAVVGVRWCTGAVLDVVLSEVDFWRANTLSLVSSVGLSCCGGERHVAGDKVREALEECREVGCWLAVVRT